MSLSSALPSLLLLAAEDAADDWRRPMVVVFEDVELDVLCDLCSDARQWNRKEMCNFGNFLLGDEEIYDIDSEIDSRQSDLELLSAHHVRSLRARVPCG